MYAKDDINAYVRTSIDVLGAMPGELITSEMFSCPIKELYECEQVVTFGTSSIPPPPPPPPPPSPFKAVGQPNDIHQTPTSTNDERGTEG